MNKIERRIGATVLATALTVLPGCGNELNSNLVDCQNGPTEKQTTVQLLDGNYTSLDAGNVTLYPRKDGGIDIQLGLSKQRLVVGAQEGSVLYEAKDKGFHIASKGRDENDVSTKAAIDIACRPVKDTK